MGSDVPFNINDFESQLKYAGYDNTINSELSESAGCRSLVRTVFVKSLTFCVVLFIG